MHSYLMSLCPEHIVQPILSEEHFERALNSARPSVPKNELARLGKM